MIGNDVAISRKELENAKYERERKGKELRRNGKKTKTICAAGGRGEGTCKSERVTDGKGRTGKQGRQFNQPSSP